MFFYSISDTLIGSRVFGHRVHYVESITPLWFTLRSEHE